MGAALLVEPCSRVCMMPPVVEALGVRVQLPHAVSRRKRLRRCNVEAPYDPLKVFPIIGYCPVFIIPLIPFVNTPPVSVARRMPDCVSVKTVSSDITNLRQGLSAPSPSCSRSRSLIHLQAIVIRMHRYPLQAIVILRSFSLESRKAFDKTLEPKLRNTTKHTATSTHTNTHTNSHGRIDALLTDAHAQSHTAAVMREEEKEKEEENMLT